MRPTTSAWPAFLRRSIFPLYAWPSPRSRTTGPMGTYGPRVQTKPCTEWCAPYRAYAPYRHNGLLALARTRSRGVAGPYAHALERTDAKSGSALWSERPL
eukprot:scaffold17467_cov65-Phaeocystis_antarctica.AAC.6